MVPCTFQVTVTIATGASGPAFISKLISNLHEALLISLSNLKANQIETIHHRMPYPEDKMAELRNEFCNDKAESRAVILVSGIWFPNSGWEPKSTLCSQPGFRPPQCGSYFQIQHSRSRAHCPGAVSCARGPEDCLTPIPGTPGDA